MNIQHTNSRLSNMARSASSTCCQIVLGSLPCVSINIFKFDNLKEAKQKLNNLVTLFKKVCIEGFSHPEAQIKVVVF